MTYTTYPPGGYSLVPDVAEICPAKSAALDAILARKRGIQAQVAAVAVEASPMVGHVRVGAACRCGCGKPVSIKTTRAIYASPECRVRFRTARETEARRATKPNVRCGCGCGVEFPPNGHRKYATPACVRRVDNAAHKEWKRLRREKQAKEAANGAGQD